MTDLKTTIAGFVAAGCQAAGFFVPGAHAICDPIGAAALAIFAWFSKDKS